MLNEYILSASLLYFIQQGHLLLTQTYRKHIMLRLLCGVGYVAHDISLKYMYNPFVGRIRCVFSPLNDVFLPS